MGPYLHMGEYIGARPDLISIVETPTLYSLLYIASSGVDSGGTTGGVRQQPHPHIGTGNSVPTGMGIVTVRERRASHPHSLVPIHITYRAARSYSSHLSRVPLVPVSSWTIPVQRRSILMRQGQREEKDHIIRSDWSRLGLQLRLGAHHRVISQSPILHQSYHVYNGSDRIG